MGKRRSRLSPRQLNYLAWKRWWTSVRLNAWKTMPAKMEAIRRQATERARQVKEGKDRELRCLVSTWPERMTVTELREIATKDIQYSGRYQSLVYRLSRRKMLEFREDGYWHNLCTLPSGQ
jgi:hypothetical protein